MPNTDPNNQAESAAAPEAELPPYEPPTVTSYTDEQLLEALGPAQAGGTYNVFVGPSIRSRPVGPRPHALPALAGGRLAQTNRARACLACRASRLANRHRGARSRALQPGPGRSQTDRRTVPRRPPPARLPGACPV